MACFSVLCLPLRLVTPISFYAIKINLAPVGSKMIFRVEGSYREPVICSSRIRQQILQFLLQHRSESAHSVPVTTTLRVERSNQHSTLLLLRRIDTIGELLARGF